VAKARTMAKLTYGGGTATGTGIDYQIEYAALRALELVAAHQGNPVLSAAIGVETRGEDLIPCDIIVRPPERRIEAKGNLTASDVEEWIDAVVAAPEDVTEFELVYGAGGTSKLFRALASMRPVAKEFEGAQFDQHARLRLEQNAFGTEVLDRLGPRAGSLVARMTIRQLPYDEVTRLLHTYARTLVAAGDVEAVVARTREAMRRSLRTKQTLRAADLIREVMKGVTVQTLPAPIADAQPFRDVLVVLQTCPSGLPKEVLVAVAERPSEEVREGLQRLAEQGLVEEDDGAWRPMPLPTRLSDAGRQAALTRALRALTGYIQGRPGVPRVQVHNIVALGRACRAIEPELVAGLFSAIERAAKDLGDKHVVLSLAELSISAAQSLSGSRLAISEEARALICGRSWVLQRGGELEDALAAAGRSERLAEDVGARTTLAFVKKCSGRLYRLQAERMPEGSSQRVARLQASVAALERARDEFTALIGTEKITKAEAGDCFSLLARTHLVAGSREPAFAAIRDAYARLTPDDGKDYIDLLLVAGECELTFGDPAAAFGLFTEALNRSERDRPDYSEMRARAFFALGRYHRRSDQRLASAPAADAFRRAADMWERLDEPDNAAMARLAEVDARSVDELPGQIRRSTEPDLVRWLAFLDFQRRAAPSRSARAARARPLTDAEWSAIYTDARANARAQRHWG
jgi:tetratricopeptide (TPR) repeat protein